ncbi:MAG: adenylosuccinate lyase [Tenuifilaceae bacterium]|jgi:adenylosuccinate lyase|uniref:adenylosuccinate lyase n=1 Tax=Perlabentimonas gracilis TaxID=2715279 RepID=UPI00140B190F|nr:adenylosuccinate lyase [Perlabentimonas gracilis]MDX9770633.1 adenylosuccinate lyase [Tenuifilaceae bacterium]NHB67176.1 adenylosuccinate lyase [Perlabentimonas gracilis]
MELSRLTAISPIDGRYRNSLDKLDAYFSELALIRYRVMVEVEYFIALCELPLPQLKGIDSKVYADLRKLYKNFSAKDAQEVKDIEKITNHDVKAVEYFIKDRFKTLGLSDFLEFVHFGLTSQDINNTAFPSMLRDAGHEVYYPMLDELLEKLEQLAQVWADVPMLARTHGQPASPTRLGKEISVFVERINKQVNLLRKVPVSAKFGGATGNFNAHQVAYPNIDWVDFANTFVNDILGLERSQITTQIEHYDNLAATFDNLKRINVILIDLCRDVWTYISMEYFKQKIKEGEVGSSAMPHKVNPIDFENAEGNLGIANALFEHLSEKLPISRLQRDLTDSTVMRNIGVPFAHTVLSLKAIAKGLEKLVINPAAINADLERNWIVVSEAIQTILRREGYPNPYEALKDLTRTNKAISKENLHEFIDRLEVSNSVKDELKRITPFNYTGVTI